MWKCREPMHRAARSANRNRPTGKKIHVELHSTHWPCTVNGAKIEGDRVSGAMSQHDDELIALSVNVRYVLE